MKNDIYLFSIDLEDVRHGVLNGNSYQSRVEANTRLFLTWLNKNKSKCTFFTTGNVAKYYPSLINEIVQEGHEIACHTTNHLPLDKQTPATLKKDLEENKLLLLKAGATEIKGFRAPIFSLTEQTQWAYDVLEELGFTYSSSVLPAKNPLYGWEAFGGNIRSKKGITEIPMTIGKYGPFRIPYSGGIYFRVLPYFIIKQLFKKRDVNTPLVGYFHPYDIDVEQEKFMHPGINNNPFYNWLMYYNRKNVFNRLDSLLEKGFKICTYEEFLKQRSLKE